MEDNVDNDEEVVRGRGNRTTADVERRTGEEERNAGGGEIKQRRRHK